MSNELDPDDRARWAIPTQPPPGPRSDLEGLAKREAGEPVDDMGDVDAFVAERSLAFIREQRDAATAKREELRIALAGLLDTVGSANFRRGIEIARFEAAVATARRALGK